MNMFYHEKMDLIIQNIAINAYDTTSISLNGHFFIFVVFVFVVVVVTNLNFIFSSFKDNFLRSL